MDVDDDVLLGLQRTPEEPAGEWHLAAAAWTLQKEGKKEDKKVKVVAFALRTRYPRAQNKGLLSMYFGNGSVRHHGTGM